MVSTSRSSTEAGARPIAGLIKDLKQRGLLDSTLVIWGGEFGRTPMSESGNGRDHNPYGFTMFMAGGGVKPGITFGTTDEILGHTDAAMRVGQIAIQRQRVLAFADALGGAVGEHLHSAQDQMGPGILRLHRQRPVEHCFRRLSNHHLIFDNKHNRHYGRSPKRTPTLDADYDKGFAGNLGANA